MGVRTFRFGLIGVGSGLPSSLGELPLGFRRHRRWHALAGSWASYPWRARWHANFWPLAALSIFLSRLIDDIHLIVAGCNPPAQFRKSRCQVSGARCWGLENRIQGPRFRIREDSRRQVLGLARVHSQQSKVKRQVSGVGAGDFGFAIGRSSPQQEQVSGVGFWELGTGD
jgi:hypothetical protein